MSEALESGACLMNWSQVCFILVHEAELEFVMASGHRVRLPRTGEPVTERDLEIMLTTRQHVLQVLPASVATATADLAS
jgi:hypothetical protein